MLGGRYKNYRLGWGIQRQELQTQGAQAERKVGGRNGNLLSGRLAQTVFNDLTTVMRTAITGRRTVGGISMRNLRSHQFRRFKTAMLRHRQPECQKRDCDDATEKRHTAQGFEAR